MKKLNAFLVSVLATVALNAAVIEQVIVRQQWPWSTDIKVEYKLKDVTAPVDLTVEAYNGSEKLPLPGEAVTGDRYGIAEDGVGTLVIDPVAAFGTAKIALANFKVKLTVTDSPESMNEAVYKIFCLTDGTCEDVTRKDLLNGKWGSVETDFAKIGDGFNTTLKNVLIWTAVTNDVKYKTTHLVMRKIPAAGKEWKIGSPTSETTWYTGIIANGYEQPQRNVQLSEDYYIGVFELTQAQYKQISSVKTANHVGDLFPMENAHYSSLRGNLTTAQEEREYIHWPKNTKKLIVWSSSFLGLLRSKMRGVEFDLPMEAQWEYACRAGTTTALNSGKGLNVTNPWRAMTPEFDELGWCATNALSVTQTVGQKKPNAFGLYDMHGNVAEYCLDWHVAYPESPDPLVDPKGPEADSGNRVGRGGDCTLPAAQCRSAWRESKSYWQDIAYTGLRLVCPVGETWE